MPYSPIRLAQLDVSEIHTYILEVIGNDYVPVINRTAVSGTGYNVNSTDYYLAVDTSVTGTTIVFPAPSGTRVFKIKDIAGNASGFNIVLTGASGTTFDNSTSDTMADPFSSIEMIAGTGGNYEIL